MLIRNVVLHAQKDAGLLQYPEEFELLATEVDKLQPERILEIGTYSGGSLYVWLRLISADGMVVSVDLPNGYPDCNVALYNSWLIGTQQLHLIRQDSHDQQTLLKVMLALGENCFDLLFIDADHSYEGVKQDWTWYSPLVEHGGIIALHDIAAKHQNQSIDVIRFWREIRDNYDYHEILTNPEAWNGGIGWYVQP